MQVTNSIVHIVIIWSNARNVKDEIIAEIDNKFEIQNIFQVQWSKSKFVQNLKLFYSHSLKEMSDFMMYRILMSKCREIGVGNFYVVVFKDHNPNFIVRKTTSGEQIVNINVFDLKTKYRKLTGNGSKIHSSNDEWETNKDLTILFGLNTEDFLNKYSNTSKEIQFIKKNCEGVDGYDSIESFFYVINNCLKYVVLRNFEVIPEKLTREGHDDIDFLVENLNYASRLTNSIRCYPQKYRVCFNILIGNNFTPVDFRDVGDNYYDIEWEKDILNTRIFIKELLYIPNHENQFYTLLYHAFIQKRAVKSDYYPKLESYSKKIGLIFKSDSLAACRYINDFFSRDNYKVHKPCDKSVFFNQRLGLIINSWNALKECTKIKDLEPINLCQTTTSGFVHFCGKLSDKKVFLKYSPELGSCENEYSTSLKLYEFNPRNYVKPISLGDNGNYIIYEFVDGLSLSEVIENKHKYDLKNIIYQLETILKDLYEVGIIHRDIRPDNFLLVDDVVKLIDFQFATNLKNRDIINNIRISPQIEFNIGVPYRYRFYAWNDGYSFIKIFKEIGVKDNHLKVCQEYTSYMSVRNIALYIINNLCDKIQNILTSIWIKIFQIVMK